MKKLLLTIALISAGAFCTAQVKSTGTVSLGSSMTLKLDLDASTSTVTYTITGPSNKWFAIGLNATTMSTNNPIDVVMFGTSLLDRYLAGGHNAPTADTTNNLTLASNTVSGSTRTIVVTRPFSTGDDKDYTFTSSLNSLNVLWAVGSGTTVTQQHASRGTATITFTLGNEDFSLENSLAIYPVPASAVITISNPKGLAIDSVRIFDINGRAVRELAKPAMANDVVTDISTLGAGLYFVEITSGGQKTVKKFEKIQ